MKEAVYTCKLRREGRFSWSWMVWGDSVWISDDFRTNTAQGARYHSGYGWTRAGALWRAKCFVRRERRAVEKRAKRRARRGRAERVEL